MSEAPAHFHRTCSDTASKSVPQQAFGAFMRAMHAHRQLMARKLTEHGVAPAQAFCLAEIAHNDGITQRDLAESLNVARPTITVMLHKMESAGLIERRTDERDQRYTRIFLTEQGQATHTTLHALVDNVIDESVGRLSEADQLELVRLMGLVHDSMTSALDREGTTEP